MDLIFLGTPEFAVPTLERAAAAGHRILAVFTQPDRPKGRGQKNAMPPVKAAALRLGVAVHQPERIRRPEMVEQIRSLAPEVMVVVGYGQILPQAILDIPPQGTINVHASLLPKYRGAAPIQWAVAKGETRTGVTTMLLNAGLDTGDMLLKWETEIGPEETAVELGERLAGAGADLLVRTLAELPKIRPEPQDHSQATYAPILKKEDGHINWSMVRPQILNRIRGFVPWPGCHTFVFPRHQRLHIWRAIPSDLPAPPQGWLKVDGRRLFAGTGDLPIELLEVQLEGKKRLHVAELLNGSIFQGVRSTKCDL
jgi:methionyl-tRNA formyltransferase